MAEILYSIFTVAYQIVLLDAIFGVPKDVKSRSFHAAYGVLWSAVLYLAGNLTSGIGTFYPYIFSFLIFELLFVFVFCTGSILCRFATVMVCWTTFIMSKTLMTYAGVEGITLYFFSVALELVLALYIYAQRFNEARSLDIRESGYLSITCAMMFIVTLSEVSIVLQDFRKNMVMGGIGWKIIGLFIMTELVIYSLISYLSKEYSRKMYKTVVEEKKSHSNELKELHKLNHEFKNKVFYMKEMLEAKNYDRLESYIAENFDLKVLSDEDFTGNKVIDDCIKIKMEKAKQKGIDFQIEAGTLPENAIDEGDLTELIFNLLDNAIEAENDEVDCKWIKMKMRFIKGYIHIEVSNATDGNVLRQNPGLSTSKDEADRHGFGMEIIKNIVNKYNGMIKIKSNGGHIEVNIMLML